MWLTSQRVCPPLPRPICRPIWLNFHTIEEIKVWCCLDQTDLVPPVLLPWLFSFTPRELRRCVYKEVVRLNDMLEARKEKVARGGKKKRAETKLCLLSDSTGQERWIIHPADRSHRTALQTKMSRCWVKTEDRAMKADVKQGSVVR